jgi:hypothetical protein
MTAPVENQVDSSQLNAFWDEVRLLAETRGLYMVNARYATKPAVTLPETFTAGEFVELVVRLGAKWLTMQRSFFDPDGYDDVFLDTVSEHEGDLILVVVTWVIDGVVYGHEIRAKWYDDLCEAVRLGRVDRTAQFEIRIVELAASLEADPEFRGLANQHDSRGRVMLLEHLTATGEAEDEDDVEWGYLISMAVKRATADVKLRRAGAHRNLFPDEQSFVDAAREAGLASNLTVKQRQVWVREFLTGKSGGYRPLVETVEQFEYCLRPGWADADAPSDSGA